VINSGNSRAVRAVRNHHAPSMSRPNSDAIVRRSRVAGRRSPQSLIMESFGSVESQALAVDGTAV